MHSYHCISFRYAICTTRGCEARADGTEHEDDVWWTYLEEAKNQEYMLGPECSPSEYHLTNTDLVLHQASPGANPII